MTMSFGAKPKLLFLFQGFALLMGLASAAAALPVAVLSFGCHGAAMFFGRVRPLRDAYELLSRAYDRVLDRLGQKILQDSRDTPALRLMVSLSLTAVPILVLQLVLGKPRLLLAMAFYLSLYGLKFQRFVRMFSASHVEAHRRQGYFSGKCEKVFGRYLEFFLAYLYGNIPELGRTAHVCLHHRENSGPDDTRNTIGYDRTSRLDFLWYLSDNIWTVLGLAPYAYFKARSDEKNRRRMFWGMARYYAYFGAVFVYDWRIGTMFVLVPLLCMNFINAITAWVHHAFCDPERPEDYFANSVTVVDEVNFMNERRIPPLPSSPRQPSLDRDASPFRAHSRQDERGWLVGLPRLGFYGTFRRIDPLSQNGCACRETCPMGAHESRAEIGFAGEED